MQCLLLHTKRDLVQHMYMKHGKFYCELCEKIFTDLRKLKTSNDIFLALKGPSIYFQATFHFKGKLDLHFKATL